MSLHPSPDQARARGVRAAASSKSAGTKKPNQIDKHVGARVHMRRMMISMSQEKLGDKLGITFQQIQKYEKGMNRISASKLQAISHELGVPIEFFFEGAPRPNGAGVVSTDPETSFINEFLTDSGGLALARAFMGIKDRQTRRHIVNLAESISSSS